MHSAVARVWELEHCCLTFIGGNIGGLEQPLVLGGAEPPVEVGVALLHQGVQAQLPGPGSLARATHLMWAPISREAVSPTGPEAASSSLSRKPSALLSMAWNSPDSSSPRDIPRLGG